MKCLVNWIPLRFHFVREIPHLTERWEANWNFGVPRDGSIFDSTWQSIFQVNVDLYFTSYKLGFLHISECLARSGIHWQMDLLVTERRCQSGKKPVLCMMGLIPTIIRRKERSEADQESATDGKIALANEHN